MSISSDAQLVQNTRAKIAAKLAAQLPKVDHNGHRLADPDPTKIVAPKN
jgi:hypothetical protein